MLLPASQNATDFLHFTSLTDGIFAKDREDLGRSAGPALLAMKTWARTADQAIEMALDFAERQGFEVTGTVRLYGTPAEEATEPETAGYDAFFTSLPQTA